MGIKRKLTIIIALVLALGIFVSCKSKEEPAKTGETNTEPKVVESVEEPKLILTDVAYLEELEKKAIEVPFELTKITPSIKPYKIEPGLSNVENAQHFGEFTQGQREFLEKNGFVITKTRLNTYDDKEFRFDQIHQIYEQNEYLIVPNFVTTDSVTHIFHIFYDGFLREIEKNELYPKSVEMTKNLLQSNIQIYENLENQRLKDLQLKNVAFFAVASELLGIEVDNIPAEAKSLADEELAKIENKTPGESSITGNMVDFSQMTVRGHYTRNEILEKYFLSTMYYGQIGYFPFVEGRVDEDAILKSLLITHSAYQDPEIFKAWAQLVDPIDFLVESADDLSIREYGKILYSTYGEEPDLNNLDDQAKLENVVQMIMELPTPQVAPFQGQSFRFVPQRAVIDNVLMQNLVDVKIGPNPSKRPIYLGLDFMATIGNEKAKEILYADEYNSYWDLYKNKLEENISLVKSFKDSTWKKNLYRGWLWMLQSYKNTYGEGYPMFMQNEAWERKDLMSALGSYAELKHDTVLYGKQVMAEMGGGGSIETPKGYVEPNLELFEKLAWLLEYTKVNLKDREMLDGEYEEKLDNFQKMVEMLTTLAKKELNNESFTEEEYLELHEIGGLMESIAISFVKNEDGSGLRSWYEIESATDRRMPVVVDLMMVVDNVCGIPEGKFQSIGTGTPGEIYVVYPHEGKLYMGRGGVFTYHEFISDERLTDEKWQERLLTEDVEVPYWYNDLIFEEKSEFEGNMEAYW